MGGGQLTQTKMYIHIVSVYFMLNIIIIENIIANDLYIHIT